MGSTPNSAEPPELMSKPAAARRAGVGCRQLDRAVKVGSVPVFQIGGWPRVRWRDVLRWIESQRVPPTDHARARVAEIIDRERGRDG